MKGLHKTNPREFWEKMRLIHGVEVCVLCDGGCGRRIVPVQADDAGAQRGPWYCEDCFALGNDQNHA